MENAPAGLISLIVHLGLLIGLALFTYRSDAPRQHTITARQSAQQADVVLQSIEIESSEPSLDPATEPLNFGREPLELLEQPIVDPWIEAVELASVDMPIDLSVRRESVRAIPVALSEPPPPLDLEGYSSSFSKIIFDAYEHGIEIAIVFDSTGSMRDEIEAVKRRTATICSSVLSKLPKARFSLVTYRDRTDQYLVRGIPFDNSIPHLVNFANHVTANGGGDTPEALHAGMAWALTQNDFRPYSRKAMLIFGDAPPHRLFLDRCVNMARQFHRSGKASVHTVTCRQPMPLPEFYLIANAGGGRAFVFSDTRRLMEELLVLAFGPEHRHEVLRFFEI